MTDEDDFDELQSLLGTDGRSVQDERCVFGNKAKTKCSGKVLFRKGLSAVACDRHWAERSIRHLLEGHTGYGKSETVYHITTQQLRRCVRRQIIITNPPYPRGK